jgi:hypothetical protein
MKKLLLIIAFCGLAILSAAGQSNSKNTEGRPPSSTLPSHADLLNLFPDSVPAERLEMMGRFQARTMTRILGIDLDVDGVLPQLRRADYPLHLFNPLAPAHYGSGVENLSIDPVTRRANGIVFLSIRF